MCLKLCCVSARSVSGKIFATGSQSCPTAISTSYIALQPARHRFTAIRGSKHAIIPNKGCRMLRWKYQLRKAFLCSRCCAMSVILVSRNSQNPLERHCAYLDSIRRICKIRKPIYLRPRHAAAKTVHPWLLQFIEGGAKIGDCIASKHK